MDTPALFEIAREAMRQRGLQPDFSAAAQQEASAMTEPVAPPGAALRDLRELLWCSIDNDDSRDLDQLTVALPEADDVQRILVAIADVDALVHDGGAIDAHARTNTTSVYTAAGVFPMLPLRLSTDLSSLNENEDRQAIVVEIAIGAPGASSAPQVYRALVRNRAQLSYNAVAAWLDGKAPVPPKVAALPGLEAQLRTQDRAGQALKEMRRRHGALSLATPEARPVFDGDGVLTDLRVDDGNRAKELIAGFMIAANGVTARFLDERNFPSLRRFLREPARWQKIAEIAAGFGAELPAEPSPIALDGFLTQRRLAAPEKFAELSLTIVKLLGSGEYMLSRPGQRAPGHFGLAVNDYTHSTAPNRRYPDLITQRLLKAALRGAAPPLGDAELTQLAQHCTEQEDNANKVERQVRKSAAALLLAARIGQSFNAIVTGVSAKGTWVRIASPVAEGRVVQGYEGLDVGDKLHVTLVALDVARGFIDFKRV
ncbi:MAG TPA: RNB domain-containing ribonuclease [Burkholderiaceae bacterium]|nr:RNB domain-containing ribonuclease [Burkholderiaceae bacterium]